MEKERVRIFYFGTIFFCLCIIFVILAGCTSTSSSQSQPSSSPTEQQYVKSDDLTSIVVATQEEEDMKANSISQAIDYTNPTTRDFAVRLVKNTDSGSYDKIGVNQICDIWDNIRPPHWTYVNDPAGPDYYSPASRTINLGLKGDCDDFAILNAAVVQSIGGKSQIITACDSLSSCHAYAVVYINDNEADLQSTTNYIGSRYGVKTVYYLRSDSPLLGSSYWLNLDWQASNPGGEFFNDNGEKDIFSPGGGHYVSTNSDDTVISQTVTPTTIQLLNVIPEPTPTIDWSELRVTPTPTPTIDWSKLHVTPTPTIEYDWSLKLKK